MDDRLLTGQEVRKMTGHSRPFLNQLDKDGVLPAIRIGKKEKTGGKRRWRLSVIQAYMRGETNE